jgi:hypothetical protein
VVAAGNAAIGGSIIAVQVAHISGLPDIHPGLSDIHKDPSDRPLIAQADAAQELYLAPKGLEVYFSRRYRVMIWPVAKL